MLIIGQRVKVNIKDFATNDAGIDELIQGAVGTITGVNSFVYPYVLKLDDPNLNKLITKTPRQFSEFELRIL